MNLQRMHHPSHTLALITLSACAGLASIATAQAADTPTAASIESQYQLDVQRCNSGQTNQDKATCLKEAGAARDAAKRNQLDNNQSANYTTNSTERCTKLAQPEREDCLLQMRSPSEVKGSVDSGGILRETVIQVPPGTPGSTTVPGVPSNTTEPMPAATPGNAATPLPVQ